MRENELSSTAVDLERRLLDLCSIDAIAPRGLAFRRLAPSPVDVRLFFGAGTLDGADGTELVARLASEPCVAEARRRKDDVTLRLSDRYVDELTYTLSADELPPLATPRPGPRWLVNYLNPNATKPLHVGHLRNVALGEALASGLEAAGLSVVRQCYVCDIGRNVCEALAGWIDFHGASETPGHARPDVFVGECYARYASAAARAAGRGEDERDPLAAEARLAHDHADRLLAHWLAGDARVRGLWARLRGWALAGQARTLARLGARMDRVHHESWSVAPALELARRGLAAGIFEREPDGTIVYRTGRSEYPCAELVRADGFPTEHLRVIALFVAEQAEAEGVARWIVVCGDEWSSAGDVELEIAERLGPCPLRPRVEMLAHGMVTLSGAKMKSRDGRAVLIDELFDELEASAAVRALRTEEGADSPAPAELVELATKGFFLSRKPVKSIEFDLAELTDPARNPGWLLARAWCRAHARARSSGPAADPALVRSAALQYWQLRQLVAGAPDAFAGIEIAKHAIGFARWYLELGSPSHAPRLAAVVRGVLALASTSLGLACARRYSNTTSK